MSLLILMLSRDATEQPVSGMQCDDVTFYYLLRLLRIPAKQVLKEVPDTR